MTHDSVEVNIYGRQYNVLATKDEEYIRKLAYIVDRKMQEIAEQLDNTSTTAIAILTCLNFVDDLMQIKKKTKSDIEELDQQITEIVKEIDIRLSQDK